MLPSVKVFPFRYRFDVLAIELPGRHQEKLKGGLYSKGLVYLISMKDAVLRLYIYAAPSLHSRYPFVVLFYTSFNLLVIRILVYEGQSEYVHVGILTI